MNHTLTVLASGQASEENWCKQLRSALDVAGMRGAQVAPGTGAEELGQVIFLDASWPGHEAALESLDRRGRAVFLIVPEGAEVPLALQSGKVDDVLVHPFRALEVLSKVRHYQQILNWEEVSRLNASFSELVTSLHEDLQLAERLQKGRLPMRFPELKGFRAHSRYLAGMRSGGDYFDIAESKDGSQLSIVLSDSSSYGLSSAVLSSLMRVSLKLSTEQSRSSVEMLRKIHEDLMSTLSPKDRLSMFYGVLFRRENRLRFVNLGSSCAFYAHGDEPFRQLASQAGPLVRDQGFPSVEEAELRLAPLDRLVLVSDGFIEAAGGAEPMCELLDGFRKRESVEALNELVYRVKSKFTEPDDLPEQDCTALILDVDSRVIQLAPSGDGPSLRK
jgi:serine phosphatase RsbU (regulator of sigma subunit)